MPRPLDRRPCIDPSQSILGPSLFLHGSEEGAKPEKHGGLSGVWRWLTQSLYSDGHRLVSNATLAYFNKVGSHDKDHGSLSTFLAEALERVTKDLMIFTLSSVSIRETIGRRSARQAHGQGTQSTHSAALRLVHGFYLPLLASVSRYPLKFD